LSGVPLVAAGRLGGPLQHAIHTYKYRGRPRLAIDFAEPLSQAIKRARLPIRALTFVPLHEARQHERGFNQAERLALALRRRLELPLIAGLRRIRATPAQVGLRQEERRMNLRGAFEWTAREPVPEHLAVVDDVCTTGATLEACAEAVRQAGGSVAAFLVLARAQTLPELSVTSAEQSACL
jgi:ComF family protein